MVGGAWRPQIFRAHFDPQRAANDGRPAFELVHGKADSSSEEPLQRGFRAVAANHAFHVAELATGIEEQTVVKASRPPEDVFPEPIEEPGGAAGHVVVQTGASLGEPDGRSHEPGDLEEEPGSGSRILNVAQQGFAEADSVNHTLNYAAGARRRIAPMPILAATGFQAGVGRALGLSPDRAHSTLRVWFRLPVVAPPEGAESESDEASDQEGEGVRFRGIVQRGRSRVAQFQGSAVEVIGPEAVGVQPEREREVMRPAPLAES